MKYISLLPSSLVVTLVLTCAQSAVAQGVNNDPFENATVTRNSPLLECCGGSNVNNLFGATGGVEPPNTLFADAPGFGALNFVEFSIASGVTLGGVNLFAQSDNGTESGNRSTSGFTFLADLNGDGSFETTLVPFNDPVDNSAIGNSYTFNPVTTRAFRAEFTNGSGSGLRILELDGVAVPEPGSLTLAFAGGLGLLGGLRRRRA